MIDVPGPQAPPSPSGSDIGHRSPALCLVAQLVADSDDALYLAHGGGQAVPDLVGLRTASKGHDALPDGDGEGLRVQG